MDLFAKPLAVRNAEKSMSSAGSYSEWAEAARRHDELSGMEEWKGTEISHLYDYRVVQARLKSLRQCRLEGDDRGLLFTLNEGIHGNMGGMGNSRLFSRAKFGTKKLIHDYIDEIVGALRYLADREHPDISFEEKVDFFHRASHCFGRTALMLSGGAALGNFHLGVIKTLVEENLMPKVVSGASAGAIMGAIVGTNTPERLAHLFEAENLVTASRKEANLIRRLWDNGYRKIDRDALVEMVAHYIPDLTFEEAYNRTGIYLNITVSPAEPRQNSRLLNAIASPNVLIRSAVMASSAVPGIFPPVMLEAKDKCGSVKPYLPQRKWVDGSFSDDLPAKRLSRLYGINHYIVSLTNPMVLPFTFDPVNSSEISRTMVRWAKAGFSEYASILSRLNRRYLKRLPRVESLISLYTSVVGQNYTGDINIICRFSMLEPRRLLTILTPEEMMELIEHGERETWPKVEAIRTTTRIGRLLDDILDQYESREMKLAMIAMKYRTGQERMAANE